MSKRVLSSNKTKLPRRPETALNGVVPDEEAEPTVKLSVNVAEDVGVRLRHVAFEQRLSESSIVEVALRLLFKRSDNVSLGGLLRQQGASLRRRRRRP